MCVHSMGTLNAILTWVGPDAHFGAKDAVVITGIRIIQLAIKIVSVPVEEKPLVRMA